MRIELQVENGADQVRGVRLATVDTSVPLLMLPQELVKNLGLGKWKSGTSRPRPGTVVGPVTVRGPGRILSRPSDDGRQVGRAVWFGDGWGALVSGASRPRVGEAFWLFLRTTREWRVVAVTEVIDGWPGHWRVRKRFLDSGWRLSGASQAVA